MHGLLPADKSTGISEESALTIDGGKPFALAEPNLTCPESAHAIHAKYEKAPTRIKYHLY